MRCSLLCLLIIATVTLRAQQHSADTTSHPAPTPRTERTFITSDTASASIPESKSPALAMLYSAVLPGAGQAYNGSYWKVPVVAGLGVYFVSEWLNYNRLTGEYRDKYNESLLTNPIGDSRLYSRREFYKTQRDAFAWYFFILYVLNLVDAYVDASLSGFDVGENLALRFGPRAGRWEVRLQF